MSRVRIWTAPERLIGEAVIDELREAGLPVLGMPAGTELYPSSPLYDIYLEDDRLLADPTVRQAIQDAIGDRPMTEEEMNRAAEMPFEDRDAESTRNWTRLLVVFGVLVLIMAGVALGVRALSGPD